MGANSVVNKVSVAGKNKPQQNCWGWYVLSFKLALRSQLEVLFGLCLQ